MTTREQDQFIEGLGTDAQVLPLPDWAHPAGILDRNIIVVPTRDGHQVGVPMLVPPDVGPNHLARAASSSEIRIAQDAARRGTSV